MPYVSLLTAARAKKSTTARGFINQIPQDQPANPLSIRRQFSWPLSPWGTVRDWCTPAAAASNYLGTQFVAPLSTATPQNVAQIVSTIKDAEATHRRVHAVGSLWSFSDCAITPDVLVNTRLLKNDLTDIRNLDRAFNGSQPPHVRYVEAGITIHELYINLNDKGLALETMGGASGQTLAGAISTGTHGGDLFMPPLADSVLAIHLVAAGGTQYWIEPTAAITDKSLLHQFVVPDIAPEHIIHDDNWFNSVLVSMGCMGIIYAVVLRVRPKYNLIETTAETTWENFKQNAATQLSDKSIRFLQLALAPYADGNGNLVTLVTTRREGDITGLESVPKSSLKGAIGDLYLALDVALHTTITGDAFGDEHEGRNPNNRLIDVVNLVLLQHPEHRDILETHYNAIMKAAWPPGKTTGDVSFKVMDATRLRPATGSGDSDPPAVATDSGYSIEMFFPAQNCIGFIDDFIHLVQNARSTFLVGYVGIRFTGQTRAFLGMQQWSQTCSVEIATIAGIHGGFALLSEMLDLMRAHGGVPHWGQLLDLHSQGNASIYPNFPKWREVYGSLSNNFTTRTFENDLSVRWKLTLPQIN